jgi:hypothetical protein
MKRYHITVRFAPLENGVTYTAIGQRDALINAAYDHGAMGVTILEIKPTK